MYYLHNWMKGLKDTRKLVELCLPGSHDAGVYTDEDKDVRPGDKARCQHKNIHEQARVGSRVFDIRCFLDGKTPKMGHFFKDTPGLGDWGGTLESALSDAVKFLGLHTSEFLIFRIGHTECLKEVAEVLEKFYTKTDDHGKMPNATLFYRGAQPNLADVEVRHLRGKLVVLCDNQEWESSHFKPGDGYYLYNKYPTIPTKGLSFCGTYVGDLNPFKDTNWSAKGAKNVALAASNEHKDHNPPDDHLFWVYWQETGGNVLAKTTAAKGMKYRLENFLAKFRDPNNKLRLPNVIGHDFVDNFTCSRIVKMNSDLASTLDTYS